MRFTTNHKAFLLLIIILYSAYCKAQTPINIWEGTKCKAKVELTPYLAKSKDAPAIIVCPGGSYFWHDMETEGVGVAKWLQDNGISAFVLKYRVGTIAGFITHHRILTRGNRYPDMLQDIQRSIQLIRDNSDRYDINPDKIGVIGFSAGGHLTAMSGLFFDTDVLTQLGVTPTVSLKPNFIAPIYPVVSFSAPCTHKRSRRGALGEGKAISREMKDSLSLEKHVRVDMPPTFLMNCVDDPIVKYQNSELLDSAMTAMGVKHKYIQYKTGGHGFGATESKTSKEAIQWKQEFLSWLKEIGITNE
ncbi:MAG: alpha/beta hydrolase [Muribaculaceae bacterium]|nr:alpha/beta hydrolase [Muribaculaceae bacterium]